jgi:predicted  nucleic acid-binding Zn-ribbon protein
MKVHMTVMDASALEIVVRCTKCQQSTRFKAEDWNDELLAGCVHCGERWSDAQGAQAVREALRQLQAIIREYGEPQSQTQSFTLRFGTTRVVRNAA